jgi:hypothetical protein
MIEKLNLELPTHVVNCQEKKAALQQQWQGQVNVEGRMTNDEVRYSVDFIKKRLSEHISQNWLRRPRAKPSFDILRFCGSHLTSCSFLYGFGSQGVEVLDTDI